MDGGHENPSINLHREMIFPNNISTLFRKHHVPLQFDYLSVDLDSFDLFVLYNILEAGYRPRVISAEYNANYHLDSYLTVTYDIPRELYKDHTQDADRVYGASVAAYDLLGKKFGYSLVYVVKFLDVFLVRNDLLASAPPVPLEYFRNMTSAYNFHAAAPARGDLLLCFKTWLATHDLSQARKAAMESISMLKMPIIDRNSH